MLFIDFFMKNLYFIVIYFFFDLADFAFGFSNAWKNNAVQSKKMKMGIVKFFGYLLIILCCICVDVMLYIGTGIQAIDTLSPIAKTVTVFICFSEFVSIIENAQKLGLQVPEFLLKIVSIMRDSDDDK